MRLDVVARGRDNNFQLIRLFAATAVVVFHCYTLTNHWMEEPIFRLAHRYNLGALGVQMFFVISGFLVTKSWLERRHLASFLAARALRIYPALVLATALTVMLAAHSSLLPWREFMGSEVTRSYIAHTALGWNVRDALPQAYAHPTPGSVNGPLWTLPIEIRLYIGIALAGLAGLLHRRAAWTAAILVLAALVLLAPTFLPEPWQDPAAQQLAVLFALGSLAFVWAHRIPLSLASFIVMMVVLAVNPWRVLDLTLFALAVAYGVLVLAFDPRLQWRAARRIGDYSYGVYVYAFPVQRTVLEAMPDLSPMQLFAIAFPIVLSLAMLSWHFVEQPCLRWKPRAGAAEVTRERAAST